MVSRSSTGAQTLSSLRKGTSHGKRAVGKGSLWRARKRKQEAPGKLDWMHLNRLQEINCRKVDRSRAFEPFLGSSRRYEDDDNDRGGKLLPRPRGRGAPSALAPSGEISAGEKARIRASRRPSERHPVSLKGSEREGGRGRKRDKRGAKEGGKQRTKKKL